LWETQETKMQRQVDRYKSNLNDWAKEQMAEAVIQHSAEVLGCLDLPYEKVIAIRKQRNRVLKFLGHMEKLGVRCET